MPGGPGWTVDPLDALVMRARVIGRWIASGKGAIAGLLYFVALRYLGQLLPGIVIAELVILHVFLSSSKA
jgi:hypothetical protein